VFNDLEGNVIDWALPSKRSRSTKGPEAHCLPWARSKIVLQTSWISCEKWRKEKKNL